MSKNNGDSAEEPTVRFPISGDTFLSQQPLPKPMDKPERFGGATEGEGYGAEGPGFGAKGEGFEAEGGGFGAGIKGYSGGSGTTGRQPDIFLGKNLILVILNAKWL